MFSIIFTILFAVFIGRLTYQRGIKEGWNQSLAWIGGLFLGSVSYALARAMYEVGGIEEAKYYLVAVIAFCGLVCGCLFKEESFHIKTNTNPDGLYNLVDVLGVYSSGMFVVVILYNIFGGSVPEGTPQPTAPATVVETPAPPALDGASKAQPETAFNSQVVEDVPAKHEKKQHVEQASLIEKPAKRKRDSCDNLPDTCPYMQDCDQAYQAMNCGNYRLDKDNDGVPCESICGSN